MGNVLKSGTQNVAEEETISFVSGREECVEKKVVWKIANFSEFLAQLEKEEESRNTGIVFEAGHCVLKDGTRSRATWNYYLTNESYWVGGYLRLLSNNQGAESEATNSAKAWHSVTLSSGLRTIKFKNTDRNDFGGQGKDRAWGWDSIASKSHLLKKTRGRNVLKVTLRLKVFFTHDFTPVLQDISSGLGLQTQTQMLKGEMTKDLVKLLETGNGADVEIKVSIYSGGNLDKASYTKKAHKLILVSRSSVFSAMFEQEMTEAEKGEVVITDMSPRGLDIFLHYLYSGEVLEDWVKVPEEIINSAEKYDLGELKKYCEQHLLSAVTQSNAPTLFQVAKLHKLPFAKRAIIAEYITKNRVAVLDNDD